MSLRCPWVLGSLVLLAVGTLPWWRLNVSPSVPLGLYRLHAVPATLTVGQLVLLPVPASVRPWHSAWLPLLKPVAAVAGETVCVEEGSLRIGAVDYGPAYAEAQGRPLPHLDGCLIVQPGEVFLAGRVEQSLDSRYFGPVRVAHLTAQAVPLLTWRSRWTPVILRHRWPR